MIRSHCSNSLGQNVSCRMSRKGKVSYCTINPALNKKATTLFPSDAVICPCYCGSYRVLSGNPLQFATGLICGPLIMGKSSDIVRAHVVSLSGKSRLGGAIISFSGLRRVAPIIANVMLRGRGPVKCDFSTSTNCVTCTSSARGTTGGGKIVCVKTMFPTAIGKTFTRIFSRGRQGRHKSTLNRILTIGSCRPKTRCVCC